MYTAIHRAVAPTVDAPAYAMRFDSTIFNTFWKYLVWARGVNHFSGPHAPPSWIWTAGTAAILIALTVFTVVQVRQGKKAVLFLVAWFVILLAPVLPLRAPFSII